MKFALWVDRVTNKKSISTSPFKLVYGVDAIFPAQLALPVAKLLQEVDSEPNDLTRRIDNLVELQQNREQLLEKIALHQSRMKEIFDRKVKKDIFKAGDLVLKWDAARRKKENMENLMHSGQVLLLSHQHSRIILLFFKILQGKKYPMVPSMGGFSKFIFHKMFSVLFVHILSVFSFKS